MFLNLPRFGTWLAHTCSGTIGMPVTGTLMYSMLAWGFLVVITSVVGFGAVTVAKLATSEPFEVAATWLCMIRLKVQAASAAVSGLPSDHFSPDRILKVQVRWSGEVVQEVARYGAGLPCSVIMVSVG